MFSKNEIPDVFYCQMCVNFWHNGFCSAFPEGIPLEILQGENDHSKPLPDQDNDIVFEPVNED